MSICPGLTDEQLQQTNGCGSSAWFAKPFRIPKRFSFGFWCACNCHDVNYSNKKKTTLTDKHIFDDRLYDAWYYDAFHGDPKRKDIKLKVADLGYWALNTKVSEWAWRKAKK